MNRKEQEKKLKESIILDSAENIFREVGYQKANLTLIAQKASYSKASLYSYFKNKNEICLAILNRLLEEIAIIFEKQISVENLIQSYIDFQTNHPFALEIILKFRMNYSSCKASSNIKSNNVSLNKRIRKAIADVVVMSRSSGEKNQIIKPEMIAYVLWGNLDGILPGLMQFEVSEYSKEAVSNKIISILTKGII